MTDQDHTGCVSDDLCNLIMYRTNIFTFLKYYLSRWVDKNLAGIIRGLDP
jgi:hypothetical protein